MTRQRRWARPGASQADMQFAVFTLGSLEYAIDIMRIKQIIRPLEVRPVPEVAGLIDGVIEMRGVVIPVMDLRRRFGLEPDPNTRGSKFIIVRLERRLIGLVVDRVIGVHRVSREAIRATPHWITGPAAAVFSGVCRRDTSLVLLIDLPRLVSSRDTLELEALSMPRVLSWPQESAPEASPPAAVPADDFFDDWPEGGPDHG